MRDEHRTNHWYAALTCAAALTAACGGDFQTGAAVSNHGASTDSGSSGRSGSLDAGSGGSPSSSDAGSSGGNPGDSGAAGAGGTNDAGGTASGGRKGHGTGGVSDGGSTSAGGTASSGGTNGAGGTTGGTAGATGGALGSGGAGGAPGSGGTGGTVLHASDFDRLCKYDSQCSLVSEGDVCDCNTCNNAAIASTAQSKWNADVASFNCAPPICPLGLLPCPAVVASCGSDSCYARKPVYIVASNYDQSCSSNTDCVTLPLGEICASCQCSLGAVSKQGYADYLKEKDKVSCSPGPGVCDCIPSAGSVVCSQGTCAIQ